MSPAHPLGRRFFTPHFRLLPLVNELPLSAGARVTLTRCLRRAQKTGNGDALEGEALFWTTPQTLAQETGLSLPTQRRRLKELRAAGFLRWRLVDQGKALPNGAPAEVSSTVFYVQVRALETSLRVGTELASVGLREGGGVDQFDQPGVINLINPPPLSDPQNRSNSDDPQTLSLSVNHRLKLTTDLRSDARATPGPLAGPASGGGGGSGSNESESERQSETGAIFEAWWERIGAPHQLLRAGSTATDVRAAIASSLARGFSARDLLDVVEAASDRRIGGAYKIHDETPWEFCQRKEVFGKALFGGGCLEKLLASARRCREADQKRADAAARMAHERPAAASCGVDRPIGETDAHGPASWQQRPTAETLRAELDAALRARTGIRRRA